jgi:hypothetical protein
VLGVFLFTTASRPAQGPTQPSILWVPGVFSLGVKRLGREADHSPPSSAEVKKAWNYTSTSPVRLYVVVFSYEKRRDNFTFILPYIISGSSIEGICNYTSTLLIAALVLVLFKKGNSEF